MPECIIIGHRGAAGLAPENTLLSFRIALNLGVPMIELDIHETLDGHLVCIHDSSVERTTDGTGNVSELTLQELRMFDAGMGEKIPLLREVLDLARNRMKVNIELKTLGVEKSMTDLVVFQKMTQEVVVSSFLHDTLLTTKELNPNISTAILLDKLRSDLISYAKDLRSNAINPHFSFASKEMIDESHSNNFKIYPWTVNDSSQMLELLKMGVDGIITDYPNLGLDIVKDFLDSRY